MTDLLRLLLPPWHCMRGGMLAAGRVDPYLEQRVRACHRLRRELRQHPRQRAIVARRCRLAGAHILRSGWHCQHPGIVADMQQQDNLAAINLIYWRTTFTRVALSQGRRVSSRSRNRMLTHMPILPLACGMVHPTTVSLGSTMYSICTS